MGKNFEAIDEKLTAWIERQHVFFVATAPAGDGGHVNCSPKGGDSFRILGPRRVAYQDLVGSGIETVAHLRDNGRIVIMFCAFEGPPKIVRLHGRGRVVVEGDDDYSDLAGIFSPHDGTRAFIEVEVSRIADSCGYGVPLMDFRSDRDVLEKWVENRGRDGVKEYQRKKNVMSLDGLPGLTPET